MLPPNVISLEFLLWTQLLFLWSTAAYGISADPLPEETTDENTRFRWTRWLSILTARVFFVAAFTYVLSQSLVLSGLLLVATFLQPLLRYRLRMRWLAEFEALCIAAFMGCSLFTIRYFHLAAGYVPAAITPGHLAAFCVLASTLLIVVRGGTYIVRGILRKSGTLKSRQLIPALAEGDAEVAVVSIAAAAEESRLDELLPLTVDVEEYNRGRLIGNLERIVLTIVVAAGSYAALAFLVAAKGVVRADEFEKNRDFTEYFLIGSLSSVLVALVAGIVLRVALIRLWPDLLTLQIQ